MLQPPTPTLAGFDFPIGLPVDYGRQTGFSDFLEALPALGNAPGWADFFSVGRSADAVQVAQPFYPANGRPVLNQAAFAARLNLTTPQLRRWCEQAGPSRRAASPLFWTVGPAQVGKAAITGWRDVIRPALARGARLWPFEGDLARLAGSAALVLAETYPADCYAPLGLIFGRRSKRRQDDRRAVATDLLARGRRHAITLSQECEAAISAGFAPEHGGEDGFDALVGLLGMIEVVAGRRPEMPARVPAPSWEGWILGAGLPGTAKAGDGI